MSALATPENVAALDRAAELIGDESRWCRGAYRRSDGRCCAVGAIHLFASSARTAFCLVVAATEARAPVLEWVNDKLGRIPAKHVIEALAAQLRSELP